jgi:hypothetical protein
MNSRLCVVAALCLACGAQQVAPNARLLGTNDILLNGNKLFVTSANGNELRVIQIEKTTQQPKGFVTAPNPLGALSIPTLSRPTTLTGDQRFSDEGGKVDGNYVFVTRPGSNEISIVGANALAEVKRLVAASPVTATAAWLLGSQQSILYYAAFDGSDSAIFKVTLPTNSDELAKLSPEALALSTERIIQLPGEVVNGLLTVPQYAQRKVDGVAFCSGNEECLVVDSRTLSGGVTTARMVDPASRQAVPLNFGGPVRDLAIASRVVLLVNDQPVDALHEGERIFALLDESRCTGEVCAGVVAVDTKTGTSSSGFSRALDFTNQPMLPLTTGGAFPVGLSLANAVQLAIPADLSAERMPGLATYALLGALTAGNGNVLLFDAFRLTQLDTDGLGPSFDAAAAFVPTIGDDGRTFFEQVEYVEGPIYKRDDKVVPTAADGALFRQSIVTVVRGPIPGLTDVSATVSGTTLTILPSLLERLRAGDAVTLRSGQSICAKSTIAAVTSLVVTLSDFATCPSLVRVDVEAGTTDPLIVAGRTPVSVRYFGRTSPNGELSVKVPQAVRLVDGPDLPVSLSLKFGPSRDSGGKPLPAGTFWELDFNSHFSPYQVLADPSQDPGLAIGCGVQLPGRPVWDSVRNKILIAYPSGDGVVEFDPTRFAPRALSFADGVFCYR